MISAALAPVFVLLLGNLAQPLWFMNGYAAQQANRPEWAFWDATRIVPGTVNEFPFFTFLFADLHAHMIVMPLSLALLGLGVAIVRRPRASATFGWFNTLSLIAMIGLLVGALRATNTWDYPTFVGLTAIAFAIAAWNAFRREASPSARVGIVVGMLLLPFAASLILGNLLFAPFTQHFTTASSGIELLHDGARESRIAQLLGAERTTLWDELRLYGLWLVIVIAGGLVLIKHVIGLEFRIQDSARRSGNESLLTIVALGGSLAVLVLIGLWREWSALVLLLPLLVSGTWLCWNLRNYPPPLLLPAVWGTAAIGLLVLVEIVVVTGDVGRMNTVFKFGLHSWILFALMGAVAVPWLMQRALSRLRFGLQFQPTNGAYGALVLLLALLRGGPQHVYPLTATPARLADRWNPAAPRSLDGAAFMATISSATGGPEHALDEDAAAIDWLQRNVPGTPIILEAHRPSYQWAGRIATYTGLPTLLGWEWHQIQQREVVNARPAIANRQNAIQTIYSTPDPQAALDLIHDYGIEYVYVGGAERAAYDTTGLSKFTVLVTSGALEEAFSQGQTQIFRVTEPGVPGVLTSDILIEAPTRETPPATDARHPGKRVARQSVITPGIAGRATRRCWQACSGWRCSMALHCWACRWRLRSLATGAMVVGPGRVSSACLCSATSSGCLPHSACGPTIAGVCSLAG
ncbi:hypothetical protein HC891_24185 [Candidatus Gracilibacteria bacterium]|nr:hypothetical protein [Candidatus Gracilibacteria bacterium]